jgi:uncharacterized membrane protein YfcA
MTAVLVATPSPVVTIAAVAALVAAVGMVLRSSGRPRAGWTLLVTATLCAFFAAWTGGLASGHQPVGMLLFVAAIATFRLMNRFERPPGRAGGSPWPAPVRDRPADR